MKKALITFYLFIGICTVIDAQISSVKYILKYNETTTFYDVKLYIEEGSATSLVHRTQFNSLISVVVPTGSTVLIPESYNPIVNNHFYGGTAPCEWLLGPPVVSPPAQPENDFYYIYPTLIPVCSYNDIYQGDTITLLNLDINDLLFILHRSNKLSINRQVPISEDFRAFLL